MKRAVIIVASGRGTRAGTVTPPKQYVSISGKPLLAYTLTPFLSDDRIDAVQVVINQDHETFYEHCKNYIPNVDKLMPPVYGGATRQASVRHGLLALQALNPDYVMIHDGVRPFVSSQLLDRIVQSAVGGVSVLPAVPVRGTLKKGDNGHVTTTLTRDDVYEAQTPQVFPFDAVLKAHEVAVTAGEANFTDDASIMEWAGHQIQIINGDDLNMKVTYPTDFTVVKALLANRETRVGQGYDVHRFSEGDHITLCGVKIPHTHRLDGHSDADVALHAVTDALLGTVGAGDIGVHFPPSDEQWRDAASEKFVAFAVKKIFEAGGEISNVDLAIIAEEPKITPHRDEMQANLARMLGIAPNRVGIKATTNERMGFVGRKEGIAALATASVKLSYDEPNFPED